MKRQNEWDKLQEENEDLKSNIIKLRNENESLMRRFKHLIESKFIRSFDMVDGNGSWSRPIDEADRIAYGNDTPPSDGGVFELQKKLKESNSGEDLHIIYNPKVIIIRFDRIQTIDYKESLTALFKNQGIVCVILDRCEIDYIC